MRFAGTWHIEAMDMWDADYFNMEVQAYITIGPTGRGRFQFGLVSGEIDGEVVLEDAEERFDFTWEGVDELDQVSGSGWLRFKDEETLEGRIGFHMGDRSGFSARRAE